MTIVVFDIGKVLVPEGDRVTRLVNAIAESGVSVDTESLMNAYWAHRDEYDLGLPDEEYWPRVLSDAGVTPAEIESVNPLDLGALDGQRNATLSAEAAELLRELQAADVPVALLSNAPHSMVQAVTASQWAQGIRARVFSADVGVAKPNQEIFRLAERELEKTFGTHQRNDVIFFDDRSVNVEGAQAFGWRGEEWKDVHHARELLASVLSQ